MKWMASSGLVLMAAVLPFFRQAPVCEIDVEILEHEDGCILWRFSAETTEHCKYVCSSSRRLTCGEHPQGEVFKLLLNGNGSGKGRRKIVFNRKVDGKATPWQFSDVSAKVQIDRLIDWPGEMLDSRCVLNVAIRDDSVVIDHRWSGEQVIDLNFRVKYGATFLVSPDPQIEDESQGVPPPSHGHVSGQRSVTECSDWGADGSALP